jgi:hypothetical protein
MLLYHHRQNKKESHKGVQDRLQHTHRASCTKKETHDQNQENYRRMQMRILPMTIWIWRIKTDVPACEKNQPVFCWLIRFCYKFSLFSVSLSLVFISVPW